LGLGLRILEEGRSKARVCSFVGGGGDFFFFDFLFFLLYVRKYKSLEDVSAI